MWKKPEYTQREINKAGEIIICPDRTVDELFWAMDVVDNWRAAHAYPMNTFAINLKRQVADIDGAIVAQRLKRADTIYGKLRRYPTMKLYRMQDLGGCRVIVPTIGDVYKVKERMEKSRIRHKRKDPKDYIETPKPTTGYRGIHLIYKYKSEKTTDYNGLCVEIQIRTKLQHLWATAVEMVGVFTENGLKFNQGSEEWIRYFKLISALFSIEEGTSIVEGVPSKLYDLLDELMSMEDRLSAVETLFAIGQAQRVYGHIGKWKRGGYYLLIIDFNKNTIDVKTFDGMEKGLDEATRAYNEVENKNDPMIDAVLVSAESYEALVDAYPNYFANIQEFILKYLELTEKYINIVRKEREETVTV